MSNIIQTTVQPDSQTYKIRCPSCRSINNISHEQKPIIGGELECIVCQEKVINAIIYFPTCGHANICLNCCKQMDRNVTHSSSNPDPALVPPEFGDNRIRPSTQINEAFANTSEWFEIPFTGIYEHSEGKNVAKTIFGIRDGKVFLHSDVGMGCDMLYKRDGVNGDIEAFFMHSDSWGQYGSSSSEVPELNQFVEGYTFVRNI